MSQAFKNWLPGVLNGRQLEQLYADGTILGERPGDFGKSSMDLTLSDDAWELTLGSLKPRKDKVFSIQLQHNTNFFKRLQPDNGDSFTLKPSTTYIFKLQQRLNQQVIKDWNVYGQSTAKSSIGRMDLLARLIVDGMDCYESFSPGEIASTGDMYIEITPLTFPVLVKKGTSITQLRLFYGSPANCEFDGREVHLATIAGDGKHDGYLRVDLADVEVGSSKGCAFEAHRINTVRPVPLYKTEGQDRPDPTEYWQIKSAKETQDKELYIPIEKEAFYILRSKELLALDGSVAVYCMAIDETIGEMRIHYAGFVHPWFGRDRDDNKTGTPLIFEVRGHDVQVALQDGEKLAKLRYFRMSEAVERGEPEQYNKQTLKLSNFFGDWE